MNSVNVEAAEEQVTSFLQLLRDNHAVYKAVYARTQGTSYPRFRITRARDAATEDESHRLLLRLHPIIEEIAVAVDQGADRDGFKPAGLNWRWSGVIEQAERLAGILERREMRATLFEPSGPRLQADRLHPWVWDAAKNLWDDGHYGHAVYDASKAVERQAQMKLNRLDLDGRDLYAQAFSASDPEVGVSRLRFIEIDKTRQPKRWTSAHEGAQFLGMGCAQGIRNPQAHGTDELNEQEALEQLATLSVLARWVESSELEQQDPS